MKFQVVTKVPDFEDNAAMVGNLAACFGLWAAGADSTSVSRIDPMTSVLTLRVPVFQLGEVIIVNDDGRELVGHMRKASKWDVTVEEFTDVKKAVKRAIEVSP